MTAWGRSGMVGADDRSRRDEVARRAAAWMVCPARVAHAAGAEDVVAPIPGESGIRARFRCQACGLVFAISEAQLQARLLERLPGADA